MDTRTQNTGFSTWNTLCIEHYVPLKQKLGFCWPPCTSPRPSPRWRGIWDRLQLWRKPTSMWTRPPTTVKLSWTSCQTLCRPYEHNSTECQCVGLAKSFARYVDLQFPPCSWTHILLVVAQQPSFCRETPLCFSFEASLLPAPSNHNSPSWQPGSPDTANLVLSTRAWQGQWSEWAAEWKGDCEERNDVPSRLQSRFLSLFGLLPTFLIWPAGTLSSTTLLASSNFYSCHRNTTGVACHHWEKTKLAIY